MACGLSNLWLAFKMHPKLFRNATGIRKSNLLANFPYEYKLLLPAIELSSVKLSCVQYTSMAWECFRKGMTSSKRYRLVPKDCFFQRDREEHSGLHSTIYERAEDSHREQRQWIFQTGFYWLVVSQWSKLYRQQFCSTSKNPFLKSSNNSV